MGVIYVDNRNNCSFYNNPNYYEYLIEYRGNFLEEISKVSYACGDIINNRFAIVSVKAGMIDNLILDVPSILFVNFREMFILESTSPENVSNIYQVKLNPYLSLDGSGILVGIVDTGIDYLNQEFIREDNTSRIDTIWDQTSPSNEGSSLFIGKAYSNDDINKAIQVQLKGEDPYNIVPSTDTIGHGTEMAGIIGARGYSKELKGVANNCTFAVVKLIQSATFQHDLKLNGFELPVYNTAEVVAGIEYLRQYASEKNKPIVIFLGFGCTDYSHDGSGLFAKYIDEVGSFRGVVVVTSTGNEGNAELHSSGYINNIGEINTSELNLTKQLNNLSFRIWIRKPNKMSLNVISPSGQSTKFITSKLYKSETFSFVYEATKLTLKFYVPDNVTGNQVIILTFTDIKPGIWKLQLKGEYIADGRYDIWLPPAITLPEGTKFLNSDPEVTLSLPSSSKKIVSVGYYDQESDSIVGKSGNGFPLNTYIKPDIAAPGVNILTTSLSNKTTTVSGASVAAAITSGVCALLLQWGIVERNDLTMYASKIISYLIAGASRKPFDIYPNAHWGYGKLDFLGTINALSGTRNLESQNNFDLEYSLNNMLLRFTLKKEVLFGDETFF